MGLDAIGVGRFTTGALRRVGRELHVSQDESLLVDPEPRCYALGLAIANAVTVVVANADRLAER